LGARGGEHGMKGDDERRGDSLDKIEEHRACWSTEYPELMLNPDGIDAASIDRLRRGAVGGGILGLDEAGDIGIARIRPVGAQCIDIDRDVRMLARQMIEDVSGIGRNSAAPGAEATDKGNPARDGGRGRQGRKRWAD